MRRKIRIVFLLVLLIVLVFGAKCGCAQKYGSFMNIPFGISINKFHLQLLNKEFTFLKELPNGNYVYKFNSYNKDWFTVVDKSMIYYKNTPMGPQLDSCVGKVTNISHTNKKDSKEIYSDLYSHYVLSDGEPEIKDKTNNEMPTCMWTLKNNTYLVLEYKEKEGIILTYAGKFELNEDGTLK